MPPPRDIKQWDIPTTPPTTAKSQACTRILAASCDTFGEKDDGLGMGWADFAGGGTNLRQPRNREFDASRREPHLHLVPRRGRRKWESPRHRNYRTNPRVADDDSTRREILKERHVSTSVMPSASP